LRAVTPDEEQALRRTAKASSERVDGIQRAQALLGVRAISTQSKVEENLSEICNPYCGSV
jgi:hypothetical protein